VYTFTVELAGTGTAALNIWNGEENVPSQPIQLSSTFQTHSVTVSVLSPNPQFQILDSDSTTSAVNVYFTNPTVTLVGPASGLPLYQIAFGGQDSTLTLTSYDGVPAFEWQVSSALGHSDWVYSYPPFVAGDTYQVSAQVAGSGTVEINVWDGNENVSGSPVTLTTNFQTITETVLVLAPNTVVVSPSTPEFQMVESFRSIKRRGEPVPILIARRDCTQQMIRLLRDLDARDNGARLHTLNGSTRAISYCQWDDLVLDPGVASLLRDDFEAFGEREAIVGGRLPRSANAPTPFPKSLY
jgi:hypothetical protein